MYINLAGSVQHFQWVNFQFGLKINATYPGEHSDINKFGAATKTEAQGVILSFIG